MPEAHDREDARSVEERGGRRLIVIGLSVIAAWTAAFLVGLSWFRRAVERTRR